MKHFVLLTLAMQLFAGCAMADFYLYTYWTQDDLMRSRYFLFVRPADVPLSCEKLVGSFKDMWLPIEDCSGYWGICCDGAGCDSYNYDVSKVNRIEMHTNWGHYTWYRYGNNHLVDTQNNVVGTCTAVPIGTDAQNCDLLDNNYRQRGEQILHCIANSSVWPA